MKSPKPTTAHISLRPEKSSSISNGQTPQNHTSSSQRFASPKRSAAPQTSSEVKSPRKNNQSPNPALRSFVHTASPREIPNVLLSAGMTKTNSNSDQTFSAKAGLVKSISVPKLNLKANTPREKQGVTPREKKDATPIKQRYQTQSNNPFLRDGYRRIETLEKMYPEIENFPANPLEVNLTPRGAMTDRSSGTMSKGRKDISKEPFNPAILVTWSKKFEKYQQQIGDRAKLLEEEARNHHSQSKKHEETANQIKEMRVNLQVGAEHSDKSKQNKEVARPNSVSNSKKMNGYLHAERNRQNFLEKKKEELNKAEEVAIERLRASLNVELQAKEALNRLSAMRASQNNLDRTKTKAPPKTTRK